MPVVPLFGKDKRYIGTVSYGDQTFRFTIITEPNNNTRVAVKDEIRGYLVGKCLGITDDDVTGNLNSGNYSAVCKVENKHADDDAIGTLQYMGWCTERPEEAQMWMNDVCRLTSLPKEERPAVSPVAILMMLLEELTFRHGVHEMGLFVSKEPAAGAARLLNIYDKSYGYTLVTSDSARPCAPEGDTYFVMRKALAAPAHYYLSAPKRATSARRRSTASNRGAGGGAAAAAPRRSTRHKKSEASHGRTNRT
jgi:hypothetical protein